MIYWTFRASAHSGPRPW